MLRGCTVAEALEDREEGVVLAGFSVFGEGFGKNATFATAEEAIRAIDELHARGD